MGERITVYVTRWADTRGIVRVEGEKRVSLEGRVSVYPKLNSYMSFALGPGVFLNFDDARADYVDRLKRKLVSVQKKASTLTREIAAAQNGEIEVVDWDDL